MLRTINLSGSKLCISIILEAIPVFSIGECIEGYFGVLPKHLEKEVDVIKEISMKHIIAVWKKIVYFQRDH